MMPIHALIFLVLGFCSVYAGAINCKGCTPLDEVTFDKMIKSFPYSIIKFDVAYPYGDKHEEFAKVAVEAGDLPKLFVGEVGIKDYGEKDNEELGKRFGITKDDLPVVHIFKKVGDKVENVMFESEFSSENLKNFIRQHTGIYMPLPGCVESLNNVADRLTGGKIDAAQAKELMQKEADKLTEEKMKEKAQVYLKIVKKVASDGLEFVAKETERTKKMLEQKLADKKKKELNEKINVLRAFTKNEKAKDEL